MPEIVFRAAIGWDDCVQCENLQKVIWRTRDGSDVVPASLLITAHKNGGLLLGAFEEDRMVGFVFGFLGRAKVDQIVRLKLCSHILGVHPDFRGLGLAYQLKTRQRLHLRSQNIDLATWTFDPLQSVNAWLNIRRLGGIARRYIRDAYGEMRDELNSGVASDRLEVEWWLDSRRVIEILESGRDRARYRSPAAQPIYEIEIDEQSLPRITAEAGFDAETCSVQIAPDIARIKEMDLSLAREWRIRTRSTFESAFALNYVVVDFVKWEEEGPRTAYILQKGYALE